MIKDFILEFMMKHVPPRGDEEIIRKLKEQERLKKEQEEVTVVPDPSVTSDMKGAK